MSTTKTIRAFEATATRDGRWWFIEIPELNTVGQARTVKEIPEIAREIAALWLNVDPSEVEVNVDVRVPGDAGDLWSTANAKETEAREAVKEAARLRREAVRNLTAQGISQSDTGRILGLSTQRISQPTHS
ncbi:MAG: antitoxin HicB [Terrimesophilobacter sp.]